MAFVRYSYGKILHKLLRTVDAVNLFLNWGKIKTDQ